MKVLIANYRYFVSSGPERYLFNVASRLEAAGHEVAPFSIRYRRNAPTPYEKYFVSPLGGDDDIYFDQHKNSPAAIGKTFARLIYSPEVERAVGQMADDVKPDIAYVLYYLRKLSPSLLVALKKRRIPIVVRLSDYGMFCAEHHCLRDNAPCTACITNGPWESVRHGCLKSSRAISAIEAAATSFHHWRGYFDMIDAFVATNPFMLDMMQRAGFDANRLHCIPTFTDTNAFRPPHDGAECKYLLCLGRLDPPKGVDVLIRAMSVLRARLGAATPPLKIVGAGHQQNYVEQLRAQVEAAGLTDLVHFHGEAKPDETAALFQGAICTVIPALWFENLPNSMIESLACGTPVIASNIGSLAASLEDRQEGLLATPGDPDDFARKIEHLLGDKLLRAHLSANARAAALNRFSGDAHMERLTALFGALTPQRSANSLQNFNAAPAALVGETA